MDYFIFIKDNGKIRYTEIWEEEQRYTANLFSFPLEVEEIKKGKGRFWEREAFSSFRGKAYKGNNEEMETSTLLKAINLCLNSWEVPGVEYEPEIPRTEDILDEVSLFERLKNLKEKEYLITFDDF